MTIERRGNRVYVYQSRRQGSRVVKHYCGAGPLLEATDRLLRLRRLGRWLDALDRRDALDRERGRTAALRAWLAAADRVVAAALERSGWHRPRRQWRRRRGVTVDTPVRIDDLPWVGAELAALAGDLEPDTVEKAKKGGKAALREVDEFLARPAARAFWGDLGRHVLARWVEFHAGSNVVLRRAMLRFASDLRARLAGPGADALTVLVAERVVMGWLVVYWSEYQYISLAREAGIPETELHLKRIEMANRSLLAAARTLAKVKRARLPDVLALVNINPPATSS